MDGALTLDDSLILGTLVDGRLLLRGKGGRHGGTFDGDAFDSEVISRNILNDPRSHYLHLRPSARLYGEGLEVGLKLILVEPMRMEG